MQILSPPPHQTYWKKLWAWAQEDVAEPALQVIPIHSSLRTAPPNSSFKISWDNNFSSDIENYFLFYV